jgi:short-subunit dehydrogenase
VPELISLTESTPVGLVVAAAGFGSIGPFLDQDMASEINMVDLNCRSVVELSYGFGQRMAAERRGGLVLFGSLVGFNGGRAGTLTWHSGRTVRGRTGTQERRSS